MWQEADRDEEVGVMAVTAEQGPAQSQEAAGRSAADGSPLDVMLTDAALGPVRRLLPGKAGLKFAYRLPAGRSTPPAPTSARWSTSARS